MRVLILGDLHGVWGHLNDLLNREQPDLVLQVGDFGYCPRERVEMRDQPGSASRAVNLYDPQGRIANRMGERSIPTHFCEGNHDCFQSLRELRKSGIVAVAPHVYWQPRGSVLELADGRRVLFMGGAKSCDGYWRIEGTDWWPEEEILHADDIEDLPQEVDVVISHTLPEEFMVPAFCGTRVEAEVIRQSKGWDLSPDPSRKLLSRVLAHCRPKYWFGGHFHRFYQGELQGCRWKALALVPEAGCYAWLPEASTKACAR